MVETLPVCRSCQRKTVVTGLPFCASCLLSPVTTGASGGSQPQDARLQRGSVVGKYVLDCFLGDGGFAEVYSASPGGVTAASSMVALKLIKPGMNSREITTRFQAEQRVLGKLSHPGIVRPLESGISAEGRAFFVMELVDGLPITEYCAAATLSLTARLQLFREVCRAVHHAHQKGVLHRDLKPANILVGDRAMPKVIDFGIAKALEETTGTGDTLVTRLGQVMGTPVYMPPEQAAGGDDVDVRSDVYSLGAVLYEMLTGHPPYDPEEFRKLPPSGWENHLREREPMPLGRRLHEQGQGLPYRAQDLLGGVDHIVSKCLERDPARRYASVEALETDVGNRLEGGIVSAGPPSVLYQISRILRRHRRAAALAATMLICLLATAVIGTMMALRARKAELTARVERDKAVAAGGEARSARELAERQNYHASIRLAHLRLATGQPYLAAEILRHTAPALRGWEWGYLSAATPQPAAFVDSQFHGATLICATPDGTITGLAEEQEAGVVRLADGLQVMRCQLQGKAQRIALSEDGQLLAAVSKTKDAEMLEVFRMDGVRAWHQALQESAHIAWEPKAAGGALLMVCGNSVQPGPGRLARFDPQSGEVLVERELIRNKVAGEALAISRGGTVAVVRTSFSGLAVFELPSLRLRRELPDNGVAVRHFLLDEAKNRVLLAQDYAVYEQSLTEEGTPRPVGSLQTGTAESGGVRKEPVQRLNTLEDGRWIIQGLSLQQIEHGIPVGLPMTPENQAVGLRDGHRLCLLTGGRVEKRPERTVPVNYNPPETETLMGPEGRAVTFLPDSSQVLFQTWERSSINFSPPGNPSQSFTLWMKQDSGAEWKGLPATGVGGEVVVSQQGGLGLISPAGPRSRVITMPDTEGAWSARFLAQPNQLAVSLPDSVRVIDTKTNQVLREWPLPRENRMLLTAGDQRTIHAWGPSGRLHLLPAHGGAPSTLSFPASAVNRPYPLPASLHPGGKWIAMGNTDEGWAVYRIEDEPGRAVITNQLEFHGHVSALAFDPSGRRLAVATADSNLRLYDWELQLNLLDFPVRAACSAIAFSPDGEWLASTDYNPSLVLRSAGTR